MRPAAPRSRRERRQEGGPAGRRWLGPLILGLLAVLLLLGADRSLRGPVVTSEGLRGRRNAEREARAERAFLNAQLALAHTDSLNIVLDARDSRLWIVMKGVRLRECRLPSVAFDAAILKLVSGENEALWLERPFILKERRGNLPDPWKPLTEGTVDTLKGPVAARELPMNGSLVFDRDLVLHIIPPPSAADSLAHRGFRGFLTGLSERRREVADAWREIFEGPAALDIYLQISREDAAAVLRALPSGGGMALRI